MYWLPKLHKIQIGTRFIIVLKNCSTNPLSDGVSKVFKIIFSHINTIDGNGLFYTSFKKFSVVEKSFQLLLNWIK